MCSEGESRRFEISHVVPGAETILYQMVTIEGIGNRTLVFKTSSFILSLFRRILQATQLHKLLLGMVMCW